MAKFYLSEKYFENTCWCKTSYLNVVNHFNGSCLDIGENGMLCDMRFKSMPIYIFKTPVVRLRKLAVFSKCSWLYIEDSKFVKQIADILRQFMKSKYARLKTTYFNFPDEVVIKDTANISSEAIGQPTDVTENTEVILTFTMQTNVSKAYTFVTPILKTVKYIFY